MNSPCSGFKKYLLAVLSLIISFSLSAQQYELNTGWKCIRSSLVNKTGGEVSKPSYQLKGWMPVVVPGTVLTTLLQNKQIPDPFYGMNNDSIPDIYKVGRDYYTYWFTKDFTEKPINGQYVWLQFRGVNYSCDIYLNGHKVNERQESGMFLRHEFNITPLLAKDGHNRLAVIVYPPDPVGNPNGGQGGDGTIAHSITNQYVAGWDWIQPVRDRNTGIWDKVFIKKTKQARVSNTHIITLVPGIREPEGIQAPATIKVTTEITNPANKELNGVARYTLNGKTVSVHAAIQAHGSAMIIFPDLVFNNPELWWPNGYGSQHLYTIKVAFLVNGKTVADEETVSFGVRELNAVWNTHTQSRELRVNGQKIFIKGGNWIVSDEMLRCSKERYDAEVRYHRDMNLNLIRVWGGGMTERPEFYDACDKYGLLVLQDFWVSGDCNGRWYDPLKLEDTNARRNYPDDHRLFITSLADQVKMLRNHPSLALWCGGNEIRPPADVLIPLRDSILPSLDGTRFFFEYSNDDSMSYRSGDGPYTIQPDTFFWQHRSFPFNSEVGSVGIGDYESLERFIPKKHLVPPRYDEASRKWVIDSVWQYHKYVGYDSVMESYGHARNINDFAEKAQLINYNQYRALIEGATAHMWDWYTGIIIWKTQNPWTAMVGQMYDVYLDPNACLYGLSEGAKPMHIMYDPLKGARIIANNTSCARNKLKERIDVWNRDTIITSYVIDLSVPANSCVSDTMRLDDLFRGIGKDDEHFICLSLYDSSGEIDQNVYWLPGACGDYSWLNYMTAPKIRTSAVHKSKGRILVTISNPGLGRRSDLAFFIRVSVVDKKTKKRILPAFCNNNYISVLPGAKKSVEVEFTPQKGVEPMICIEGWNVLKHYINIKH